MTFEVVHSCGGSMAIYGCGIASLDKQFVVAYALGRASDQPPILTVHGHEFPGLESSEPRPIYLKTLELAGTSMGAWVEQLLAWSSLTNSMSWPELMGHRVSHERPPAN